VGERTLVMGVLNVTPDSFAETEHALDPGRAVDIGLRLIDQGADILDVGGESTRPGAEAVDQEEELRRILPVVVALAARTTVPISIDTSKAAVAREALAAGARIVNDISGLRYDAALGGVAAESGAALILMHTRGRPREMYREADYGQIERDVATELDERVTVAVEAGVGRDRILIDPGLGFAKRAEQSFRTLAHLPVIAELGRPVVIGPSRKSFLQAAVGQVVPAERDWATAGAVTAAVLLGAHIVRVHAVREMVQAVRVADRVREEFERASGPRESRGPA
jgi:dihydropteroate synthase